MYGGIDFGDLVQNSPVHQTKIPTNVSGYTARIVVMVMLAQCNSVIVDL